MLENITKKKVDIAYNQISIEVGPGKSLDVRDFKVAGDQIAAVERHLMIKNPGVFKQSKTQDMEVSLKEYEEKIDVLEKENADLKGKLEEAQKYVDEAQEKMNAVIAENEGLQSANESLAGEVAELKAKLNAAT